MALKEEVSSTDEFGDLVSSSSRKSCKAAFRGTDIKNSPFASSPEMINSGIMCALCDYNENKNHHTTFNIREPDLTP